MISRIFIFTKKNRESMTILESGIDIHSEIGTDDYTRIGDFKTENQWTALGVDYLKDSRNENRRTKNVSIEKIEKRTWIWMYVYYRFRFEIGIGKNSESIRL